MIVDGLYFSSCLSQPGKRWSHEGCTRRRKPCLSRVHSPNLRGGVGCERGRPSKRCRRGDAAWPATFTSDRKSTRLNSSHGYISYAVFCLKKKKTKARSGTLHTVSQE